MSLYKIDHGLELMLHTYFMQTSLEILLAKTWSAATATTRAPTA